MSTKAKAPKAKKSSVKKTKKSTVKKAVKKLHIAKSGDVTALTS